MIGNGAVTGRRPGLDKAEKWLETDWILGQFGKTEKEAQKSYKSFVADGMGKKESPWEELYSQVYLGKEEFLNKVHEVGRKHRHLDVPKYQKHVVKKEPARGSGEDWGSVWGKAGRDIEIRAKRRREAREVAIYWLKRESGLSLKEIGKRMGVGFSAVGNQWARIKAKMAKDRAFAKRLLKCKM